MSLPNPPIQSTPTTNHALDTKASNDTRQSLERRHDCLLVRIVRARRDLGTTKSTLVTWEYWNKRSEISDQLAQRTDIECLLEPVPDEPPQDVWGLPLDAPIKDHNLTEKRAAQRTDGNVCKKLVQRLQGGGLHLDQAQKTSTSLIKLMTPRGLGPSPSECEPIGDDEFSFYERLARSFLLALSNQTYHYPDDGFWCPVTSFKWPADGTFTPIFPWRAGQECMTAIFGRESRDDINSPKNAMIVYSVAKRLLDDGVIVIVPDVAEHPEAVRAWREREPRSYKVRVLRPDYPHWLRRSLFPPYETRRFVDLDDRPLRFRSDYRPRTAYLFYAFCAALLKRAHNGEAPTGDDPLRDALGRKWWSAGGPYMKASMIRGFVEELGSGYEGLMEGAIPDADGADPTALAAANAEILRSHFEKGKEHIEKYDPVFSGETVESEPDENDWQTG